MMRTGELVRTVLAWPAFRNHNENPYNSLLYESLPERWQAREFGLRAATIGRYDVLHMHWPELMLRGNLARGLIRLAVQVGVLTWVRWVRRKPIVWTAHNFEPHEGVHPLVLRLMRRSMRASVSGVIYLSHQGERHAAIHRAELSAIPHVVTPIGRYVSRYPRPQDPAVTRSRLLSGEAEKLVVYAGRLDRYKGVDRLVAAFSALAPGERVALKIAGRVTDDSYGRSLRLAANAAGAGIEEGWVDDQRMVDLLSAADLVVLPYRAITNSSSILLPVEYGTPVLAPRLGSIPEYSALLGGNWIQTFTGNLGPRELIEALETPQSTPPDWTHLEWAEIAATTADFYDQQMNQPPPRPAQA